MSKLFFPVLGTLVTIAGVALALDLPRLIPRSAQIKRPVDEVYMTLRQYFTDASASGFNLVSSDKQTRTLVARRSEIDDANWTRWAFCKVSAEQMIYKLSDASVTVNVHLEKAGKSDTFASVTADFQGTYVLGSNEQKVDCNSSGALEKSILATAGATESSASAYP